MPDKTVERIYQKMPNLPSPLAGEGSGMRGRIKESAR